jgi:UDP-3-O-[3-hydroxymyristoyl] glucosamine N-acyltransferase
MSMTTRQIADAIGARLVNDGTVSLSGVASPAGAGAGDLVFVEDEKLLPAALASRAGAVIAGEFGAGAETSKPLLIVNNPRLAFARAAAALAGDDAGGIHPLAVIHPDAKLGANVSVGAGAVIEAGAVIGDGSRIGPNVTIHSQVKLGERVVVQANSVLGSDGFGYVRDPATSRYTKFPQVGRLEIGDDVEIGAGCTIDRGALDATIIGRGSKLDNLVHVGHNVRIGEDVVIAAQTGISGSTVIEDGVIVGGQVGLADHVIIKRGVILGAQSGVPSNKILREPGVYWGTPARPIKEYLRELAQLARLTKREQEN